MALVAPCMAASILNSRKALALADCYADAARGRFRLHALRITLVLLPACLVALLDAWSAWHARMHAMLPFLQRQGLFVVSFAALGAWHFARRRRQRGEQVHRESWLASAPIGHEALNAQLMREAIIALLVPASAVLLILAVWAVRDLGGVLSGSAFALAAGFAVGWHHGRVPVVDAAAPLPRLRQRTAVDAARADWSALRRWPGAQWLADAQPRQHAQWVGALLLTLPAGTTPAIALLEIALLILVLAAWGLLRATRTALASSMIFLRAAPLPWRRWQTHLLLLPGCAQLALTSAIGLVALALAVPFSVVLALVLCWLFVCLGVINWALRSQGKC